MDLCRDPWDPDTDLLQVEGPAVLDTFLARLKCQEEINCEMLSSLTSTSNIHLLTNFSQSPSRGGAEPGGLGAQRFKFQRWDPLGTPLGPPWETLGF